MYNISNIILEPIILPKDFSFFHNIHLLFGEPEVGMNYGYTASPVFSPSQNDSFDDEYFLLYRRSEYAAQMEVVGAKIFKSLMGYGPELEIIKEKEEFFIASRKIHAFKEGFPNKENLDQFHGLAAMYVLCYFLCETDMHTGNFGFQNTDSSKRIFRIDMAESLDFDMLKIPLELSSLKKIPYIVEENYYGTDENFLPRSYVSSERFQKEKNTMIQLIAHTPFSFFEAIIRETVTSDLYAHKQALLTKFTKLIDQEETIAEMKVDFSKIDHSECDQASLIELLKNRHQQWQQLALEKNIEQDDSLADPGLFLEALSRVQDNESESDDEVILAADEKEATQVERPVGFFKAVNTDCPEKAKGEKAESSIDAIASTSLWV